MQKNDHRADCVGLLGWPIDGVPLVLCVMRPRLDYYIACVDLIADSCSAPAHVRFGAKRGHRNIHTGRLYGFMANAQKPVVSFFTNRAFTNPALTSVFVRPSIDWPE